MKGKSQAMEKDSKSDDLVDSEEIFYPSFLFKEIINMMVIFILVSIVLAAFFPVGLVDPSDNKNLFHCSGLFSLIYFMISG